MFKEDGNVIHFAAPKGTIIFARSIQSSHVTEKVSKSTPPSPQIPLPSTATARTRNSPNSCPESSTNSGPTAWPVCVDWPRATRACRRKRAPAAAAARPVRRTELQEAPLTMTMTMTSRIWSRARILKARLNEKDFAIFNPPPPFLPHLQLPPNQKKYMSNLSIKSSAFPNSSPQKGIKLLRTDIEKEVMRRRKIQSTQWWKLIELRPFLAFFIRGFASSFFLACFPSFLPEKGVKPGSRG
jgi:hypothetical protein